VRVFSQFNPTSLKAEFFACEVVVSNGHSLRGSWRGEAHCVESGDGKRAAMQAVRTVWRTVMRGEQFRHQGVQRFVCIADVEMCLPSLRSHEFDLHQFHSFSFCLSAAVVVSGHLQTPQSSSSDFFNALELL
jgi:hypothetical protein